MKTVLSSSLALATSLGVVALGSSLTGKSSPPSPQTRYEVSITNLTRGQVLSPGVVATHQSDLDPIFVPGVAASDELRQVAEDAVNDPLITLLENDPAVLDVALVTGTTGPIMPGETASMVVEGGGSFRHLSLVGMLVTTNDGFYGANALDLPRPPSPLSYLAPAWDAGTEENNELCAFVPGPPCGNAGVRATAGAEGYVHIHAGIHGVGDLDPATLDWRNPVARIVVKRLR